MSQPLPQPATIGRQSAAQGAALVLGSAIVWSFGGTLARFLAIEDGWTIVFWRSFFAATFLIGFMLLRDGPRGTVWLFRNMGLPGIAVGLCFAIASTSFILALAYTTVANIVLIQAGVPLIAALISWIVFRERVSLITWACHCRRDLRRRHHGVGFHRRDGLARRRCAGRPDRLRLCARDRHHPALCACADDAGCVFRDDRCRCGGGRHGARLQRHPAGTRHPRHVRGAEFRAGSRILRHRRQAHPVQRLQPFSVPPRRSWRLFGSRSFTAKSRASIPSPVEQWS